MFDNETLSRLHPDAATLSGDGATAEEIATLEFEPITAEIAALYKSWEAESGQLGWLLRQAVEIMEKTKPELVECFRNLIDDDGFGIAGFEETVAVMEHWIEKFRDSSDMLDAARARLLVVSAVIELEWPETHPALEGAVMTTPSADEIAVLAKFHLWCDARRAPAIEDDDGHNGAAADEWLIGDGSGEERGAVMTGASSGGAPHQAEFAGRGETSLRPGAALDDLIAEEKRAWDAHEPINAEADLLYFAWRSGHPKLALKIEDEKQRPAPMGLLYRRAEALQTVASDLTDRICAWIPATVEEAVTLLEWQERKQGAEEPGLTEGLVAGLRAIARNGQCDFGAERGQLVELFREWRAAWRRTSTAELEDDELDRACEELTAMERRIFDTPARDAQGLAVKAFMLAHMTSGARYDDGEPRLDGLGPAHCCTDSLLCLDKHALKSLVESLVEFLPEAEPLCAAVLAEPATLRGKERG
jgi:hypothetical protein